MAMCKTEVPIEIGHADFMHFCSNHFVTVEGDSVSESCFSLMIDGGKNLYTKIAGRYKDTFVERDGSFLFKKRTSHVDPMGE